MTGNGDTSHSGSGELNSNADIRKGGSYSPLFILSEDIVRGVFVCCTGSKCGRQLLIRKDLQKTEEHEAGLNGIHCRQ